MQTYPLPPVAIAGAPQIAEDDDPFGLVVSSLCPSIFGHEIVKVCFRLDSLSYLGRTSSRDPSWEHDLHRKHESSSARVYSIL